MAKKKPNTNTSSEKKTAAAVADRPAVNADADKKPQKNTKKPVKKTNDKPNIFKRMWKGLKGIFSELKKVTWPKGKEVGSNTVVVLVVVVLFFIVLFIIDYVLSGLLGLITNGHWTTWFI